MKIALLGPSAPYRGGIAHHNNMLVRSLRGRGHEVDMITFSRQYPSFLYPGVFQEEGGTEFADIQAERLLDSMNPISWRGVATELAAREYDLHINRFWIPLFGWMFGSIAKRLHRLSAAPTTTIVDNLLPHEKRPGDEYLTKLHFRYCTGAITQSGTVSGQFQQRFPQIPELMIPHPVYENFGESIDRGLARSTIEGLGDGPVLLFFGFVRKYKGLDRLLRAMPAILERVPNAQLLVVGEYFDNPEVYEQITRDAGISEHVHVFNKYVPNEEVAEWFSAADLLVLPYRSATNSGIVQIGYNFATPSIVTNVGSLSEVVLDGKTGLVIEDAEPETLAAAVARAFEGDCLARMREAIVEERKKYTWPSFAARFEEFVRVEVIEPG